MTPLDAAQMHEQVTHLVRDAIGSTGIVNVPVIAERVWRDHRHLNITWEDAEAMVLQSARLYTSAIEFDGKGIRPALTTAAGRIKTQPAG